MNYLIIVPTTEQLDIRSDHGCDGELAKSYMDTPDLVSHSEAVTVANKWNCGDYHPDIAVFVLYKGYEVDMIMEENDIVGFAYNECNPKFEV